MSRRKKKKSRKKGVDRKDRKAESLPRNASKLNSENYEDQLELTKKSLTDLIRYFMSNKEEISEVASLRLEHKVLDLGKLYITLSNVLYPYPQLSVSHSKVCEVGEGKPIILYVPPPHHVIVISYGKLFKILDIAHQNFQEVNLKNEKSIIQDFIFYPPKYLLFCYHNDKSLDVYDISTRQICCRFITNYQLTKLCNFNDASFMGADDGRGYIRIFPFHINEKVIEEFSASQQPVSIDPIFRIRDESREVKCLHKLMTNPFQFVSCGGYDRTDYIIRIFDTQKNKIIKMLKGHTKRVFKISSYKNENGEEIVVSAGKDQRVMFWNLSKSKNLYRSIRMGRNEIIDFLVLPNLILLTRHQNNIIKMWNIITKQRLKIITLPHPIICFSDWIVQDRLKEEEEEGENEGGQGGQLSSGSSQGREADMNFLYCSSSTTETDLPKELFELRRFDLSIRKETKEEKYLQALHGVEKEFKSNIYDLKQELRKSRSKYDQTKSLLEREQNQIEDLKRKSSTQEKEIEIMKSTISTKNAKITILKSHLESLNFKNKENESEISRLRQEIREYNMDRSVLEKRIRNLEHTISTLHSSTRGSPSRKQRNISRTLTGVNSNISSSMKNNRFKKSGSRDRFDFGHNNTFSSSSVLPFIEFGPEIVKSVDKDLICQYKKVIQQKDEIIKKLKSSSGRKTNVLEMRDDDDDTVLITRVNEHDEEFHDVSTSSISKEKSNSKDEV